MSLGRALFWIILVIEGLIAVPILYLAVIACAGLAGTNRRTRRGSPSSSGAPGLSPTFAILVPARNEEVFIDKLLASLAALDYPRSRFTVHVIADNCTDATATIARSAGWVSVHERFDERLRRKGYALAWLLDRLAGQGLEYDAYVVVDADTIVSRNLLRIMARELFLGARAVQARYTILNPTVSPATVLRWIAFTLMNDIRQQGRTILGGSSSLLGNGMCFTGALLRKYPWRAFALSEDYQYYLQLVEHGERVRYVRDAVVATVMPTRFADLRAQDIRWESTIPGQPSWKTALRLLRIGIQHRDWMRVDAALELIVPPISLLGYGCVLAVLASILAPSSLTFTIAVLLTAGLGVYVGSAFYVLRPAKDAYAALLHAPGFMAWKVLVFFVLKRRRKNATTWVATRRPSSGSQERTPVP